MIMTKKLLTVYLPFNLSYKDCYYEGYYISNRSVDGIIATVNRTNFIHWNKNGNAETHRHYY